MKEKKSRSNVNKPILILGISFVVIGCTLGVSSLAWFIRPTTTQKVDGVDGAAVGSYFAGGDGKTAETAYQIETPKQLYYFNWLQDLGYFNKKKKDASGNETSDYEQVYFVLNNDIDADGYYLPPAGTTKYPFIGNFNGAGYKISNLTISNNEDNLKKTGWPSGADSNVKGSISIVGFFGIVGEYESDAEVTGYTVEVNEVKDLYFDYLTVETNTDQTLVGLIAGYANGQLTNCGVRSGYFDFQNANVSVINSGALADNDKLSQHSLIGAYNSNHFDYKGKPGGSGSDTSGSWGGSIDIASLAKRITYIAAAKGMTAGSATKAYDMTERFKANIYYYSTPFTWDTTKDLGQSVNLQNGTCLPLNIDLDKATISGSYIDTEDIGTYYTKGSNTGEPVSDSNTGYLVGRGGDGTISSSNATPRLYNKGMNLNSSSETKKNGIRYSIYVSDKGATSISEADRTKDATGIYPVFGYDSLSFFYIDTLATNLENATYRISDTENSGKSWSTSTTSNSKDIADCGFGDIENGYYKVKHNFAKMLSSENKPDTLASGIISLDGIQLYKIGSNDIKNYGALEKGTYSDIQINGVTYDSGYEMYKAGFNFELSSSGSLKMILGTYTSASSSSGHAMPSVYEIIRSTDKKQIESAKKISAIYKFDGKYYNQYTDDSATIPNGAEKIFDLNAIYPISGKSGEGVLKNGCAYYMEIPLSAGDYFVGADSSATNCPYIMYFDIGANGADGKKDTGEEEVPPIDFVYYSNTTDKTIKPINSTKETTDSEGNITTESDYTPSKVTFAISGNPTTVYFYRVRTVDGENETITVYYVDTAGGTTSITGTGITATGSKEDYSPKDTTSSA